MTRIELSNGYTISGSEENLEAAKSLASEINTEMKKVYQEYISFAGESRAMDERDSIPHEYSDNLAAIGWKLEE